MLATQTLLYLLIFCVAASQSLFFMQSEKPMKHAVNDLNVMLGARSQRSFCSYIFQVNQVQL